MASSRTLHEEMERWLEHQADLQPAQRRMLRTLVASPEQRCDYKELFLAICPEDFRLVESVLIPALLPKPLLNRVHQSVRKLRLQLPQGVTIESIQRHGYSIHGNPRPSETPGALKGMSPPKSEDDGDATPLLRAAFQRAEDLRLGHVGLELLALTQIDLPGDGVSTGYIRQGAITQQDELRRLVLGLKLKEEKTGTNRLAPPLSPRLRVYTEHLGARFTLESFWRLVCLDERQPLRFVGHGIGHLVAPDAGTYPSHQVQHARSATVALGPEDGRILPLDPGQVIGRASSHSGPFGLYCDSAYSDISLSKQHATVLEDGQLQLHRDIFLLRAGTRTRIAADTRLPVFAGDALWLTSLTCLVLQDTPFEQPKEDR